MKPLVLSILLLTACHGSDLGTVLPKATPPDCEAADLDHSGRVDGYDLAKASCDEEIELVKACFGTTIELNIVHVCVDGQYTQFLSEEPPSETPSQWFAEQVYLSIVNQAPADGPLLEGAWNKPQPIIKFEDGGYWVSRYFCRSALPTYVNGVFAGCIPGCCGCVVCEFR